MSDADAATVAATAAATTTTTTARIVRRVSEQLGRHRDTEIGDETACQRRQRPQQMRDAQRDDCRQPADVCLGKVDEQKSKGVCVVRQRRRGGKHLEEARSGQGKQQGRARDAGSERERERQTDRYKRTSRYLSGSSTRALAAPSPPVSSSASSALMESRTLAPSSKSLASGKASSAVRASDGGPWVSGGCCCCWGRSSDYQSSIVSRQFINHLSCTGLVPHDRNESGWRSNERPCLAFCAGLAYRLEQRWRPSALRAYGSDLGVMLHCQRPGKRVDNLHDHQRQR